MSSPVSIINTAQSESRNDAVVREEALQNRPDSAFNSSFETSAPVLRSKRSFPSSIKGHRKHTTSMNKDLVAEMEKKKKNRSENTISTSLSDSFSCLPMNRSSSQTRPRNNSVSVKKPTENQHDETECVSSIEQSNLQVASSESEFKHPSISLNNSISMTDSSVETQIQANRNSDRVTRNKACVEVLTSGENHFIISSFKNELAANNSLTGVERSDIQSPSAPAQECGDDIASSDLNASAGDKRSYVQSPSASAQECEHHFASCALIASDDSTFGNSSSLDIILSGATNNNDDSCLNHADSGSLNENTLNNVLANTGNNVMATSAAYLTLSESSDSTSSQSDSDEEWEPHTENEKTLGAPLYCVKPGQWLTVAGEEDDGSVISWIAQVLAHKSNDVIIVRYLRKIESETDIAGAEDYYDKIRDALTSNASYYVFYETKTYKKKFREGFVNLKETPFVVLHESEVQIHFTWEESLKSNNCLVSFIVTPERLATIKNILKTALPVNS